MHFKTIFKSFKNKDMLKRIGIVLGILVVYRFWLILNSDGWRNYFLKSNISEYKPPTNQAWYFINLHLAVASLTSQSF